MQRAHLILLAIAIAAIATVSALPAIPQDPLYHQFADQRDLASIANFFNVASNLPFVFAACFGLWRACVLKAGAQRQAYLGFCIGVLLTAIGSSWYHLGPDTYTLLWDRLPMTISFMSLFALVLHERVWPNRNLLWPLLVFGIFALMYWYVLELVGRGDLRLYLLVQYLPMLLMPAILRLFPARYLRNDRMWLGLGLYVVAKLFEHYDFQIWDTLQIVSGHSLKHVLASCAVCSILLALQERTKYVVAAQRNWPKLRSRNLA